MSFRRIGRQTWPGYLLGAEEYVDILGIAGASNLFFTQVTIKLRCFRRFSICGWASAGYLPGAEEFLSIFFLASDGRRLRFSSHLKLVTKSDI